MTMYRIYIDGEATDHTFEAETKEEAIETYKRWSIEHYRDLFGEDPDQDQLDCWTYEAFEDEDYED